MSHSLVYIVPFKSLRNDAFEVHILKENHVGGSPIELVGGGDPLTISFESDDFLYAPICQSTAKLNIVGTDYLQDLYSSTYKSWKVDIIKNDNLIWTGFIKPETYTQNYTDHLFQLSIEADSALTVLENIEYQTKDKGYIPISEFIRKIVVATDAKYNAIYLPLTYERDDKLSLDDLLLCEHNFIDEDGEAMMCSEALEELCKFLNWTVSDYTGSLVFQDRDYNSQYRKYDLTLTTYSLVNVETEVVQNIGFNGGDNTLDFLGGYTKAIVKVDNYNVSDIIPELDYDSLKELGVFTNHDNKNYATQWQLLKNDNKFWTPYHFSWDESEVSLDEMSAELINGATLLEGFGSTFSNVFSYTFKDINKPEYSTDKISYQNALFVRMTTLNYDVNKRGPYRIPNTLHDMAPFLKINNPMSLVYPRGAIGIDFKVQALSYSENARNQVYAGNETDMIKTIYASLRIGEYYWDAFGSDPKNEWTKQESKFAIPLESSTSSGFVPINSNKVLFQGPNDAKGYIINMWDENKINPIGDLELILYTPLQPPKEFGKGPVLGGFNMSNIQVQFFPIEGKSSSNAKSDMIYENVVNENLIQELDDITFKISTYNNDGISYSKLLKNNKYVEKIYSNLMGDEVRLEEQLITRIINQYRASKVKLTQQLNYKHLLPMTVLRDNYMSNKQFAIVGGELNMASSQMTLNMVENEAN